MVRSEPPHDASVATLVGAYALDAVAPAEAAAVEAHVASCAICRRELARYREVVALLADAPRSAPGELWLRIAAGLADRGFDPLRPGEGPSRGLRP